MGRKLDLGQSIPESAKFEMGLDRSTGEDYTVFSVIQNKIISKMMVEMDRLIFSSLSVDGWQVGFNASIPDCLDAPTPRPNPLNSEYNVGSRKLDIR